LIFTSSSIYRGCPSGFTGLIAHEVYKKVLDCDLKQFLTEDTWKDSPRINAERQENGEDKKEEKKEEIGLYIDILQGPNIPIIFAHADNTINDIV